ncbi:hypothetical protein DCS_03374 [Drechmeria coniospora]|uniref:Uncharacterized protein n=1 Tax=Drechmeria coniospora TaxID=98403 RepID=A0A151GH15_DRECN|nr:hypothetical protein DCS_03374 [Drechmeria coniospora]KYK56374.1 hypothetical protein DCS_03374 [Drechmeria coniospora]
MPSTKLGSPFRSSPEPLPFPSSTWASSAGEENESDRHSSVVPNHLGPMAAFSAATGRDAPPSFETLPQASRPPPPPAALTHPRPSTCAVRAILHASTPFPGTGTTRGDRNDRMQTRACPRPKGPRPDPSRPSSRRRRRAAAISDQSCRRVEPPTAIGRRRGLPACLSTMAPSSNAALLVVCE